MVDRFERFSLAISEISKYWHLLAAEEMEKYSLKGSHSVYILTMAKCPEGLTAAEHVNKRESRAVEIAGMDLTEENRTIFYESPESIVANLRVLSKKGIPA